MISASGTDGGIPVLAQGVEGGASAGRQCRRMRLVRSLIHGELAGVVIILLAPPSWRAAGGVCHVSYGADGQM